MWPLCVAIDPSVLDDQTRFGEITEDVLVQAVIPQSAVETCHKDILRRLERCDVMPSNAGVLSTAQHGMGCHLSPLVRNDHVGISATADQIIQFAGNARA